MRVLLLCLLLVTGTLAGAQDKSWDELQRLYETYNNHRAMSFHAAMKMYSSKQPVKVIDQLQAVCRLSNGNYYMQLGPVEVVKNSRCLLTIDHDEKMILVAPVADGSQKENLTATVMDIGKLLETMKAGGARMQKVLRGNDTWLELSQLPDPGIQQCNIQYDPQTFLIKRVWMKALDEAQSAIEPVIVDISYDGYRFTAPEATWFNEGRFIAVKGKQAALQQAWKNYTLINQL